MEFEKKAPGKILEKNFCALCALYPVMTQYMDYGCCITHALFSEDTWWRRCGYKGWYGGHIIKIKMCLYYLKVSHFCFASIMENHKRILEKSWKNPGIWFWQTAGNPGVISSSNILHISLIGNFFKIFVNSWFTTNTSIIFHFKFAFNTWLMSTANPCFDCKNDRKKEAWLPVFFSIIFAIEPQAGSIQC